MSELGAGVGTGEDGAPEFLAAVDVQRNAAEVHGKRIPAGVVTQIAQIEEILFGTEQRFGTGAAGFGRNRQSVARRVEVMIGKKFVSRDLKTPFAEIGEKRRGIADAAKGEELFRAKGQNVDGGMACGKINRIELGPGVEDGSVRILADGGFDGGGVVAAGDDENVGASEGRTRLAQAPRGKQVAAAERIGRVDEDDVHVARELAMLEAVVED